MKLKAFLVSSSVAALMSVAAVAQDTATGSDSGMTGDMGTTGTMDTTGAAAPEPVFTSLEEMTVGDLLGMNVISPDGDTIGEIDYVIDDPNGALVVIGIGGFLGLGEYTVALPLRDFELDAEQRVLTLGTDKETLKSKPEIDESGLESLPDETPVAELLPSDTDSGEAASDDSTSSDVGSTGGEEGAATDDGATDEDGMAEDGTATDDGTSADDGAAADEGATDDGAAEEDAAEETEQTESTDG